MLGWEAFGHESRESKSCLVPENIVESYKFVTA